MCVNVFNIASLNAHSMLHTRHFYPLPLLPFNSSVILRWHYAIMVRTTSGTKLKVLMFSFVAYPYKFTSKSRRKLVQLTQCNTQRKLNQIYLYQIVFRRCNNPNQFEVTIKTRRGKQQLDHSPIVVTASS